MLEHYPMSLVKSFLRLPAAPGILLFIAAVLSLIAANSALTPLYNDFLDLPILFQLGDLKIHKAAILWINDGLMAIFFLLVGLEIKREVLQGHLSSISQFSLPAVAAIGGLVFPALIYFFFNQTDPVAVHGWAIPAATDIAFALGVLVLLGSRVPSALKVTLVALAVIDDLLAIVIIALFYTAKLSLTSLAVAGGATLFLFALNRMNVTRIAPYILIGIVLWVAVLKSGVHATLAGVIVGLMVPMRDRHASDHSPLVKLEHILHPWVTFFILPIFAFANAGVSFKGLTMETALSPVTMGIMFGLFIGKQVGVMLVTGLGCSLKLLKLPKDTSWIQYYGMALLTGIGFTMSLFIGNLAFETQDYAAQVRIGVLAGSVLSGLAGYLVLYLATRPKTSPQVQA